MDEQSENHKEIYQHGYSNGLEGLDQVTYSQFLQSEANFAWLTEQIVEKKATLKDVQQRVLSNSTVQKAAFDKLQTEVLELSVQKAGLNEIEEELTSSENETELLKGKRANKAPYYSLFAGLIFLLAGIAFIAGDLIISHEIVAYALNIRNPNEAWAFAIGLAMLSVLLKPAYDRLIEGPYHDENSPKAKSRYATFKLILSIFAIITLLVLGWFRYEAYRTDKLKEAINKSVKYLQLNAVDPLTGIPVTTPELTNKIETALRNSDQLNLDLVNSPWALLSFVLSGVLFAIAGAVSLGMALPVLQAFWYRWFQIDPRIGRLRRRKKRLLKVMGPIRQKIAIHGAQKSIYENELKMLEPLWDIRIEELDLKKEMEVLEIDRKEAMLASRKYIYSDGYARGEVAKKVMTAQEYDLWRSQHFTMANLAIRAKANSSSDRAISRTPKDGLRPYQAIRKVITDRFDEENS